MRYRELLWCHCPLTDFWRVGHGTARRLEKLGCRTMGDIARLSLKSENLLYRAFGINAELLIDHAWGWEPCTIKDIKEYRPSTSSLSSGQVLSVPYDFEHAAVIVREMTEQMSLELVAKGLVTDQMTLTINYDRINLEEGEGVVRYRGETKEDHYGRKVPKHAHGTANLSRQTSSTKMLTDAVMELYERITDPNLLIRRITIVACRVVPEEEAAGSREPRQLDMFTDPEAVRKEQEEEDRKLEQERSIQEAMIKIKKQFGKNAVFKGTDLLEGATGLDRNRQIGGHHE
jgi:DNA polymerase V